MTIRRAKYNVQGTNGTDNIYFETDQQSVKVLDGSKNSKGSIDDYLFKSKTVTSGAITSLKVSGNYRIKGLSDMPAGVSSTAYHMLEVTSVGADINNPTMTKYTLTDSLTGKSYERTSIASSQWKLIGGSVQDGLSNLDSSVGNASDLKTNSKVVTDAINELLSKVNTTSSSVNTLKTQMSNHNHDSRYVLKDGDSEVNGNVGLFYGKALTATDASGNKKNLVGTGTNGTVNVGDVDAITNIYGQGNQLKYNNNKLWHDGNDGKGSGLDADLVQGKDGSKLVSVDDANSFTKLNRFEKGISLGSDITWSRGSAKFTVNGGVDFYAGEHSPLSLNINGMMKSGRLILDSIAGFEPELRFKTSNGYTGITWSKQWKELAFHNWAGNRTVFSIGDQSDFPNFNRAISIRGKKLFIQGSDPVKDVDEWSGAIPEGSIWFNA
jgi:hypothetical protein